MPLTPVPLEYAERPAGELGGATILQLASGIAWRKYLRRAKFRDAEFYVDTTVRDSARRIVQHEFPKRDVPYAEDLGRRAREITIRGYIIVFPGEKMFPNDKLKKKNYIIARDKLIAELETERDPNKPSILRTPLLGILDCVCSRYRVTEEDKQGGYCTFDMTFQEYGQPPSTGTRYSPAGIYYRVEDARRAVLDSLKTGIDNAASGQI